MTAPIFPKALSSWTDRINNVDTVWAADPNSLAAEIISIESTLGTMPQVESGTPTGGPVTYSNVSTRINAAMLQSAHPYVELYASNFKVGHGSWNGGSFNTYKVVEDTFKYFNGSDITVQAAGVYIIDAYQTWDYYTSGYVALNLAINNTFARGDLWKWDFPTSGPSYSTYNGRWATTSFTWMGALAKGERIRIASENGTSKNPYTIVNSTLRMYYLRSLTSAQAAAGPSTYPV